MDKMDKKVFGQSATWEEFQQAAGLAGFTTAGGLCDFLKISRGTLSNWKTGRTKINIDSFNELVELANGRQGNENACENVPGRDYDK